MAPGRRWVGTLSVTFGTLVTLMGAPACGGSDVQQDLRAPLPPVTGARVSWSFTVRQSGPHHVGLEFSWPIADTAIGEVVQRAIGSVGTAPAPPEFDFSWQILEGETELVQGSGQEGVRGVLDSPDSRRALVFGTFPAQKGVTYILRVTPGSGFAPLHRATPAVLIERKPGA